MSETRLEELDKDFKQLTKAIQESAFSYFINGKSKWTTTLLVGLAVVLLGQAVMGAFYILVKAPTVEWVDQRIMEKILAAPITPEAQLRVTANETGLKELKQKLDGVQETNIQLKVHVQMLATSVDQLTKELKLVGFARGGR